MKHIKPDFSFKAWVRSPGWTWGGAEAKIKLFRNMVKLDIKLKGTKQTGTW